MPQPKWMKKESYCNNGRYFCDLALLEVSNNDTPVKGYIIDFKKKIVIKFDFIEFDDNVIDEYWHVDKLIDFSIDEKVFVITNIEAFDFLEKYNYPTPNGLRLEDTNRSFFHYYNFIESWSDRDILKEEKEL